MRLLIALMMVSLSLAGCAGDDGPAEGTQEFQEEALASGQGAIQGILVDDRFRPIELTEERARSQFQAEGFVLVQETGDELRTSENGEFSTPPLEPGTYTLRFTIEAHEAVPQTLTVRAGEITETTIVARRAIGTDDLILQDEFAIFIPCTFAFVVSPMQTDCTFDQSDETERYVFTMEIAEGDLRGDAGFLLTELLLNKEAGEALQGTYMMQIEGDSSAEGDGVTSYNYVSKFIKSGKYDRVVLQKGVNSEYQEDPLLTYGVWEDTTYVRWRFWGQGFFQPELADALDPVLEPAGWNVGYGVGVQLGTKMTVLASMFFTDDPAIPEQFCGLCGDLN